MNQTLLDIFAVCASMESIRHVLWLLSSAEFDVRCYLTQLAVLIDIPSVTEKPRSLIKVDSFLAVADGSIANSVHSFRLTYNFVLSVTKRAPGLRN